MNVEKQFLKTIKKYKMIKKGDKIVLGVSGGPDSVCLLHLFNKFRKELGVSIYAAHLDHCFRGKESEEDAHFVKALCEKRDIPFFGEQFDVPSFAKRYSLSPEDAARRVRHDLFRRVKEQVKAHKIATGHNQNDQEETILMNILRGAGLDGLVGIDAVSGCYIRPLIEIPRNEIEGYLKQKGIPSRIDSTNLSSEYFRNSIRLELIPLIQEKYCPHLGQSLRRLSEIAKRDLSFLNQATDKAERDSVKYESDKVSINVESFSKQHAAIKYRLARKAIERLAGNLKDFEIRHTGLLVDFIEKAQPGSMLDLPKNLKGIKEYDELVISKAGFDEVPDYYYTLPVPGELTVKEAGIIIKAYIKPKVEVAITPDANTAYLDYDKTGGNLTIRNRRPGDRFKPLGGTGLKKLKDFFIDEKLPRLKRNRIPIVEADGRIVWVGGMRIDDRFKVTDETKTVLVLTVGALRE